MGPKVSRQGEW